MRAFFFRPHAQGPHPSEPSSPAACTSLPRVRTATTQRTHRLLIFPIDAYDFPSSVEIGERRQSSSEMQAEWRNCLVAITQTKECLVLTWEKATGDQKGPSGFWQRRGQQVPPKMSSGLGRQTRLVSIGRPVFTNASISLGRITLEFYRACVPG